MLRQCSQTIYPNQATAEICLTGSCTPPFAVLGFDLDIFRFDSGKEDDDSAGSRRYLMTDNLLGTTCRVAHLEQACNEAFGTVNCKYVT